MKELLTIILGIISIGCAGIFNQATSQHRDWAFIESVGGLTIGGQDKNPNHLIIRGDVSGLAQFSTKPTSLNSGLALMKIKKNVVGSKIQIHIITTLVSGKYPNAVISGVDIAGIKKGKYQVQYLNPDGSLVDLKEITIY